MRNGLGCARFRARLTSRLDLADFFELVAWKALDYGARHTHWPSIGHVHRYSDDEADWCPGLIPAAGALCIVRSET